MPISIIPLMIVMTVFNSKDIGVDSCTNKIYCTGNLLHAVQMNQLYNSSKYFVDMKIKTRPDEVASRFETLFPPKVRIIKEQLQNFIDTHFEEAADVLENAIMEDWTSFPSYLRQIIDKPGQLWAFELHERWKLMYKRIKEDVKSNQDLYSLIYLPNPFIVPARRIGEIHYWDSYWVIRGLLISELWDTAKGMIENFVYLVQKFGFVPNGGRIYYEGRSQPPLLIPMVDIYLHHTDDTDFLKMIIDDLEKEFLFWMDKRTVLVNRNGVSYKLAVYDDSTPTGPRPESYFEDYTLAEHIKDEAEKGKFYSELKAAAESGWEFSSRWFANGRKGNILQTKIKNIIPVDLNSIICWNARLLSSFYKKLDMEGASEKYKNLSDKWVLAVEKVLWNSQHGIWLDYDTVTSKHRNDFYISNITPQWTECFKGDKEFYGSKVYSYIKSIKWEANFDFGIPTSSIESGQRWDFPYVWPPLQYIAIISLDKMNYEGKELAQDLASKWLKRNFQLYKDSQHMYEKLNLNDSLFDIGDDTGFGWTNAIVLELLYNFKDKINLSSDGAQPILEMNSLFMFGFVILTLF